MAISIQRQDLDPADSELLSPGRNWTKGTVRLYQQQGRQFVVKDYRHANPLFRRALAWWMIGHEESVLRELNDENAVPATIGRIDRFAFARDYVVGMPLQSFRPGKVPAATFRTLEEIVRRLHRRGVAHGDLHHRDIILDDRGQPSLIDFSSAVRRGGAWNPFRKWLFGQYCRMDLRSVFKLKARYLGGGLTRQEESYLIERPFLHRLGKAVRRLTVLAPVRGNR